MKLFLHDPAKDLLIVSRDRVRELRDVASARDFLESLTDDPRNEDALRKLKKKQSEPSTKKDKPATDPKARQALAERLVREGLVVIDFADERIETTPLETTPSSTPLEDEQAAEKPAAPEEPHWIEVELIDDEGNPRAGERYFVELPDGTTKSGTLDSEGRARIEGVDPGTGKVSFPDLDQDLYDPQ